MVVADTLSTPCTADILKREPEFRTSLASSLFGSQDLLGFIFFCTAETEGASARAVLTTFTRAAGDAGPSVEIAEIFRRLLGLSPETEFRRTKTLLPEGNLVSRPVFEHLDWRVRSFAHVLPFYDRFLASLGLRRIASIASDQKWAVYAAPHPWLPGIGQPTPIFALAEDPSHRPSATRLAFAATSPEQVDWAAKVARNSGATEWEPAQLCSEYGPRYYASFFADPEGNRLEVVSVLERRRPFLESDLLR